MRDQEYRAWLETQELAPRSIGTKLSDARRVDQAHGDLDEHFRQDRMASLLETFAYSTADQAAGRLNRTQLPIEGHLYNNLATYRSALTSYRRFCEAEASPSGRLSGLDRETILAAIAACDAAGSPQDFVNTLEDRGLPNRYWLVHGGMRYPSKAIVHWAMRERGLEASAGGSLCKATLEDLGFVVVDWPEIQRARDNFLRQTPGFTSFRATEGEYWDVERAYKNEMIATATRLVGSDQGSRELGEALFRLLATGGNGRPLSWRTLSEVEATDNSLSDRFYRTLGELARSEASGDEAITTAARELEVLREAGIAGLRRGEVLSIPITVWATCHPDQASWFKIAKIEEMGRRFFGRRLFPQNDFREADLAEWLQLMRALFGLLDREFGWEPQDLFDVQGFVWVALGGNEKLDTTMTDEELLSRFDNCEYFRTRRQRWTGEQTDAFCVIARAAHEAGLDWYRTNIPQIRLGRKITAEGPARATLASFDAAPGRLRFSHSSYQLGLEGRVDCNREDATAFVELMKEKGDDIANWFPPEIPRAGYWPGFAEEIDTSDLVRVEASVRDPGTPTNLILYGPPGTGKTYRTAFEAVRLCDGDADYGDDEAGRAALMARYYELADARQIEFVTFHQNFSYEDFVEGLRPNTDDVEAGTSGFSLKPEPGIFRTIAERASRPIKTGSEGISLDDRRVFKMSLGQSNNPHSAWVYEESMQDGFALFGFEDVDWSLDRYASKDAILAELQSRLPDEQVTAQRGMVKSPDRFRNHLAVGDIIIATKGLNAFRAIGLVEGEYEYAPKPHGSYCHRRKVRWLWEEPDGVPVSEIMSDRRFSLDTIYEIPKSSLNLAVLSRLINSGEGSETSGGEMLSHVLVIDEINRANISKVFGELITLIEPDKRLGRPNALKVRLPYSKREFGVPANLHIIGTMNTADRSIALLDTALRRRFRFEEIAPDTSVPAFLAAETASGLPLAKVLDTMNERIEYLVDRDHRIGHAFFIGCRNKADVDAVMRDKVIPLLQEYFFDDWDRLAAVLGEKDKGGNFLHCRQIADPLGDGPSINSWRVRGSFDAAAYDRLVSGKSAVPLVAGEDGTVDDGDPG